MENPAVKKSSEELNLTTQPRLKIIAPVDGFFVSQDKINIEIELAADTDSQEIGIKLDGEIISIAKHKEDRIYTAKIDLSETSEGNHTLQAVSIRGDVINSEYPLDSDPISLIIDRTVPIIYSVFPSEDVTVGQEGFLEVMVTASDNVSGFNLEQCIITIDNQKLQVIPIQTKKGVIFPIDTETKEGSHNIKIILFDKAGNKSIFNSNFNVVSYIKKMDDLYFKNQSDLIKKDLKKDKSFQKGILVNPRLALGEKGFSYPSMLAKVMPPPMSENTAKYFVDMNRADVRKKFSSLKRRVSAAPPQENHKAAGIFAEKLSGNKAMAKGNGSVAEPIVDEDGKFTSAAKETVSSILQNPEGVLKDMGINLTEEEKQILFPSFPKDDADTLAEWISQMHSEKFDETDDEDPESADPSQMPSVTTVKESAAAVTKETPIAALNPLKKIEPAKLLKAVNYDAADITAGVSFSKLNFALNFYFENICPGILPVYTTGEAGFPLLPFPYDKIKYELKIPIPANIKPIDVDKALISLTAQASFSITLGDDSKIGFLIECRPKYSISADNVYVYLVYDSIDITIADINTRIDNEDISTAIEDFLDKLIKTVYPSGRIPVLEQSKMQIGFPLADTEITFHNIILHDTLEGDDAELYFELGMGDKKIISGEHHGMPGDTVQLNQRYLLQQGSRPLTISVNGKELDERIWQSREDLGYASYEHPAYTYGKYALTVNYTQKSAHWTYQVLYYATYLVCILVEILVWILNLFLFFLKKKIVFKCHEKIEAVWGWMLVTKTRTIKTYTLQYSLAPVSPVYLSQKLKSFSIDQNAVYMGFDYDIPGISAEGSKTSNRSFIENADCGIAVSERMFNVLLQALWEYYPLTRAKSSKLSDLSTYAWIYLGQAPVAVFKENKITIQVTPKGEVGVNEGGPVCGAIAIPEWINGDFIPKLEKNRLNFEIKNLRWSIDNLAHFILAYVNLLAEIFDLFTPLDLTIKAGFFLDPIFTFRVAGYDFQIKPLGDIKINGSEVVLKFSVDEQAAPVSVKSAQNNNYYFTLIGNKAEKELHKIGCPHMKRFGPENCSVILGSRQDMDELYVKNILPEEILNTYLKQGYDGCHYCIPQKHWK